MPGSLLGHSERFMFEGVENSLRAQLWTVTLCVSML